ncbi:olfactory receptor 4P4-like [Tachyglossus aculeatus]|uniref:olfactory receptor 4P4-like n=1 Tax=Tachyglossus aculeatus TaxID=9261 RepID=UPI0018F5DDF9|nr:olfactory receptor 4P4-like [Tachyglossus aculeatus]
MENRNNVTEFVLLGLSSDRNLQIFFAGLFLSCYITILIGNLVILITVRGSSLIKQPMYFFLCHLSLTDVCYTSTVTPKLVRDLLSEKKTITFSHCMMQLFTLHLFGVLETFILVGMAYDRYVAICKPLHYMVIMNKQRCVTVVAVCWGVAFLHSMNQWLLVIFLPFCGPNKIDHYLCDVYPLLELACSDTYMTGFLVLTSSGAIVLVTFAVLVFSYINILASLRTHSSEGHRKALSTCTSHITVVALFFLPCMFIYLRPAQTFPEDKVFTLFYTIIAPMFNPLIYTLRNREMKTVMRKMWCWKPLFPEYQLHAEHKPKPLKEYNMDKRHDPWAQETYNHLALRHRWVRLHDSDSPKEIHLTLGKPEMTQDSESPVFWKLPPSDVKVGFPLRLETCPDAALKSRWFPVTGHKDPSTQKCITVGRLTKGLENRNNVNECVLLGLSSDRNLQMFFVRLFLSCYIAILVGNLVILITVRVLTNTGTVVSVSFAILVFSYVTILASLRTHSLEGCHKVLST